jgi:hypothetical protein
MIMAHDGQKTRKIIGFLEKKNGLHGKMVKTTMKTSWKLETPKFKIVDYQLFHHSQRCHKSAPVQGNAIGDGEEDVRNSHITGCLSIHGCSFLASLDTGLKMRD